METKEKLATLKKRAFARFKSHSYDVPSSLNFSSDSNTAASSETKNTAGNKNNIDIMQEQVETSDIQNGPNFIDRNLSLPRTG
jgi:hypothetical protein